MSDRHSKTIGAAERRSKMTQPLIEVEGVVLEYPLMPLLRISIKEALLHRSMGRSTNSVPKYVRALNSVSTVSTAVSASAS